jgi:hypothetical protein
VPKCTSSIPQGCVKGLTIGLHGTQKKNTKQKNEKLKNKKIWENSFLVSWVFLFLIRYNFLCFIIYPVGSFQKIKEIFGGSNIYKRIKPFLPLKSEICVFTIFLDAFSFFKPFISLFFLFFFYLFLLCFIYEGNNKPHGGREIKVIS